MAKIQTTYGNFIDTAGPDPLEGLLADADEAAARRQRRGPPLPPGPTRGVTIFGAGRLGSWDGLFLSQAGVPVRIVDRDVLEARNLQSSNCPYRAGDIGLPKVVAFRNLMKEQAPGVQVQPVQVDLLLMPEEELLALADGAGLILGLVDDGQALFRINEMFYARLPVVYAAGHRGALTGDVVISKPGEACLRCLLNVDSPARIQALAGEATHGIDVITIAQTSARIVLALLGDRRLGDTGEVLDPSVNFIFLENRRSPGSPGGFAPRFLRIERRPTCPVCGAL
jgi:molybdopterin/thiamine biosynthesis adenylyltransferase